MFSAALLRALLSTLPDLFWLKDPQGAFLACNPAFERLVGMREEQIVGQPDGAFFEAELAEGLRAAEQQMIATAQPLTYERWLTLLDGATRGLFQLMGAPVPAADGSPFAVLWVGRDISDAQRAQVALRESEARYRSLVDTMVQGVVYHDSEGRIITMNPAAESILGLRLDQVIGGTSIDPRWPTIREDGSPFPGEDHPVMVALRTGLPVRDVVMGVLNLPTERCTWIKINAVPQFRAGEEVPFRVYTTFEDITQRKEAEAELGRYRQRLEELVAERTAALEAANSRLRRSDRRLQSMLELSQRVNELPEADLLQLAIDEVVALTGSAVGYLHFMSDDQQTIELCSWSAGARQVCTAAYDTHYPLGSAGVWADSVRTGAPVIHNDYPSLEGRRGYPAGHVALNRHLGVPVLEEGRVRLLLGVGNKPTDYDAEDAREMELIGVDLWRIVMRRRAQAALEQARDAAEAANVAKSAFLASMSHELRTPLNAILGRVELMGEGCYGPATEQQQAALRDIQSSSDQLLALFNDVLDLSQVEAGQIELVCGPVEVEAICGGALQAVRASAAAKQISLIVSVDSQVEIIEGDGRRLKRVLEHLLRNGVKFTPDGGKVGLEVAGDRERELVTFTVWDTGIGIADEDLPGLFRPFVQLDSRLSRQYEGAGIGLALVARLVRLHGGSVTVESRPGEGSRFTVMLPWREG